MLIYQSKFELGEKIYLIKSHIFKSQQLENIPAKSLHGNEKFHVPSWSMIYVPLKFTLSFSEIEFEFQLQIDYSPKWDVEPLFPNMPLSAILQFLDLNDE